MSGLLDHIEAVMSCQALDEVWDLHTECMARYGFTRLLYGLTHHRIGNNLGDPQDMLILTNHCDDYIRPYLDDGLYFHAPMVRWSLENDGACSWRWIEDQANAGLLTPSERRVYEFNLKFEISAGYSISFADASSRTKGGIGMAAARGIGHDEIEATWNAHGREIQAINNVTHQRMTTLPHMGARRPLTGRQREVLEWVGDGKTTADIAEIMGLTVATVEKHLRLAREALDVDTTAQAVLKASYQNQIFLLEA